QASEGVSVSEEETREYYDAMKESLFKRPKGYLINVARFKEPHVAEIAAMIAEEAFDYLDAPIKRVAAPFTPVPFSPPLEKDFVYLVGLENQRLLWCMA
ncbi:transketolase C-terminal domain-containing protein, partial [Acetomicrobium sp. S15 = DSM 107314]|uniref:transketolase C-terminal domain-containing protein n=1 Tax=Acetomicrobium sp. S15 = DSM 107314 TaxID=2529858 RepID=UPI00237D30C1